MIKYLVVSVALLVGSFLANALFLVGVLSIYSLANAVPSIPVSLGLMFGLPAGVFVLGLIAFHRLVNTGALLRAGFFVLMTLCGLAQVALVPFWSCLVSRNFCL